MYHHKIKHRWRTSISIICPIIVSEGSRPSRKKLLITSSMRLLKTGNLCSSLTTQRWLIWREVNEILRNYKKGIRQVCKKGRKKKKKNPTLISSSYMNLAHWRLGSNNRAICLRIRTSKGTYTYWKIRSTWDVISLVHNMLWLKSIECGVTISQWLQRVERSLGQWDLFQHCLTILL